MHLRTIGIFYHKFLNSNYFCALTGAFVLFSWFFGIDKTGLLVLAVLGGICLMTNKNSFPVLSLVLMIPYIFRNITEVGGNFYLIADAIPLIAGIIVYFIRFGIKFEKSHYYIPLIICCAAFAAGGIFYRGITAGWLVIAAACLGILIAVGFFANTVGIKGEQFAEKLCFVFLVIGILISVQSIIYFSRQENIILAIQQKKIHLGWGCSNNIGADLCLCIPATLYFSTKKGWQVIPCLLVCFAEYGVMLLTLSRGAIISFTVLLPFILILFFVKSYHRITVIITFLLISIISGILIYIYRGTISQLFTRMIAAGMESKGRVALYKEAWSCFKAHPIFGVGYDYKYETGGLYWFHSTVLECLGKFGIIGTLPTFYLIIRRYINGFKSRSAVSYFLMLGTLGFEMYAMIDVHFFFPVNFITLALIGFVFERIKKDKEKEKVNLIFSAK